MEIHRVRLRRTAGCRDAHVDGLATNACASYYPAVMDTLAGIRQCQGGSTPAAAINGGDVVQVSRVVHAAASPSIGAMSPLPLSVHSFLWSIRGALASVLSYYTE